MAFDRLKRDGFGGNFDLDGLQRELVQLKFAAELTLYKDETGKEPLFVQGNKARTHVVECAYQISLWVEAPQLVTTPGSDFSLLCGLIYEIATGHADESLAGAINRFARSDLRKRMDRDEAQSRWENSTEYREQYEADNFAHVSEEIANLKGEFEFWKALTNSREWDENSRAQISARLMDLEESMVQTHRQHGPFFVWASQYSWGDLMRMRQEMEDKETEVLSALIELGMSKRQPKGD